MATKHKRLIEAVQSIDIEQITKDFEDGAIDVRVDALISDRVALFVEQMLAGATFPPIEVMPHLGKFVIVDGRHRFEAWDQIGEKKIKCAVLDPMSVSDMRIRALKNNVNSCALAPTKADYVMVIRSLIQDKVPPKIISQRLFSDAGLSPAFSARLVQYVLNADKQANKRKAVDAVMIWKDTDGEQGSTIEEACKKYGVPVPDIIALVKERTGKKPDAVTEARMIHARFRSLKREVKKLATTTTGLNSLVTEAKNLHSWAVSHRAAHGTLAKK